MISIVDHYYSLACFVYILSCLFFAAIRWFHTCRPYDKHGKYYYPARGLASSLFILPVILLPYAFQPGDNDAWLLVRAFYPLVYFLNCASLLLRYFGKVKKWTKWHRPAIILAVPVGILLILLFVYAISGTLLWSAGEEKALIWSVVVLGAVTSGFCIYACSRVMAWLRMVDTDLYSNPDDFPSIFARKMLFFPLSIFVIVWAVFRLFVTDPLMLGIPVLIAACPAAMIITPLCISRGKDETLASGIIFISTVLCAVTMPFLAWLLF